MISFEAGETNLTFKDVSLPRKFVYILLIKKKLDQKVKKNLIKKIKNKVSILRVESLPAFCAKKKLDQKVKKNLIKKSRIELVF